MDNRRQCVDLPAQLAEAWPVANWRDIHVLAAASGGADSMALVRALLDWKHRGGGAGRLIVGHINHRFRGDESEEDEAWLGEQCRRLHVDFAARRVETAAGSPTSEGSARAARYKLLVELADEMGARFVATAHTRDDQVETVLFRLIRGSGLRGLAGMPRTRALSASVTLVRPLLGCTREELRTYLGQLGQEWREDSTNAESRFMRNRIRNELLPYLRERFNVEVDAAVLRVAEQSGDVQAHIERQAGELLDRWLLVSTPQCVAMQASPLADQAALLVREALRVAWRRVEWPEGAMTSHWWRELAKLAQSARSPSSLNLPGDVLAKREGEQLILTRMDRDRRRPPDLAATQAAARRPT